MTDTNLITDAPAPVASALAEITSEIVAAYIIIDTAPHDRQGIVDAMRVADLVVLPTRPGAFDLAAIGATLEIARQVGKPHLAVLIACLPRTGSAEPSIVTEARNALAGMEATIAETVISQRVALGHSIMTGQTVGEYEPAGRAAAEIEAQLL